jgi:hypothetical protein
MKAKMFMMVACILLVSLTAFGQMITRTDVKWARRSLTPITLDGVLNEPGWAVAESINVVYGQSAGMPGSGWYDESPTQRRPSDPTRATVKFLTFNDSLYVGIIVRDSSVGGGPFNKFDGTLSNLRQKDQTDRPVGAGEIFYAWVKEDWADTLANQPGRLPFFGGFWGSSPYAPRPDSLKRIWDAATTVQGAQNNDAIIDQGYTMEFKLNLKVRGYNITQASGDIVMYSLSIYDADWQWPLNVARFTGNRVWVQCPWGNAAAYNHIRVYARPDVTTSSGAVPVVPAELVIPGAGNYPSPNMDGRLTEGVWQNAGIGTLQIKYGDAAIRNAYPSTAPFRSGQFQPTVNGGTAAITDPNLATVKYFYKADTLFLGFNVNDRVVQYISTDNGDRWDGFRVVLCQRNAVNGDTVLFPRELSFRVQGSGTSGSAKREGDLGTGAWDSAGTKVQVVLALKGGTTIDTLGATADSGYTAEMKVILPQLGYPTGRGDGVLFLGIMHWDGDSYTPATTSYGTRTWFMREGAFNDGAAWCWMDPSVVLGVGDQVGNGLPTEFALIGNYPNPFNPSTTIKFVLPQTSDVTLEVFDVLGRRVASQSLGVRQVGENAVTFNAANLASGVYSYRLTMATSEAMVTGKMMLLK